jgi:hypothetical protein
MLSEVSSTQKDILHIFCHMQNLDLRQGGHECKRGERKKKVRRDIKVYVYAFIMRTCQMVECLASKYETLSSIPSASQQQQKTL